MQVLVLGGRAVGFVVAEGHRWLAFVHGVAIVFNVGGRAVEGMRARRQIAGYCNEESDKERELQSPHVCSASARGSRADVAFWSLR